MVVTPGQPLAYARGSYALCFWAGCYTTDLLFGRAGR